MAPFSEIASMLRGQALGRIYLPNIDLTGKTILVTGANTGLGLECAKHLPKATEAIFNETKCKSHTTIKVWEIGLSTYASVLSFSERVRTQLRRLDAFIANAGMELQEHRVAEELEVHLTVNVVSTFLSAIAILPKLRETAKKHGVQTTLTFCGSMYHIFGPDVEFEKGLPEDVDMFKH